MEPRFRRRADGSLNLTDTMEAAKVKEANKGRPYARPLSPEVVLDKAKKSLRQLKVDPTNRKHLLGFFEIQFGVFRGQTFKWVAENALEYAAYPVTAMKRDPTGGSKDSQEHAHNKESFREYMELFPSGRIAIAMKEEQYAEKAPQHSATTTHTAATTTHAAATSTHAAATSTHAVATSTHAAATSMHATATSLRSLLVGKLPSKTKHIALAQARVQPSATITCPTVSTEAATEPSATVTSPTVSTEIDDSTLMAEASNFEEAYVACATEDQLFSFLGELLWPSPAALDATETVASEADLSASRLSKSPSYVSWLASKIRQVVALGTMYFVASEYLACPKCKRKVISWSHDIVSQLDVGHRVQFPCILTSKLACDFEVVSLMHQRGLGNSSSQIQRKLQERHAEVWLQKTVVYMTDASVADASVRPRCTAKAG
ncbi:hypothetical protein QQF64_003177 [Cirrhinus molitorella]|uniref:DUF6729 domain-containing protein n=1 Tax=Cirrhinus molitorella TaxID=172907 RepID=A0ABR3MK35_9TELE